MRWTPLRHPALLVAGAVVLLGAVGLTITRRTPRPALPRAAAVSAALQDHSIREALAGRSFKAAASPVDGRIERVVFLDGGRTLAEAAVDRHCRVVQAYDFGHSAAPFGGSELAYEPAMLVGLAALFMLMAGVAPWRRLRNLDVAAALSLTVPALLLQQGYVSASVLAAVPGISYLIARCTARALGPGKQPAPSTALLSALTPAIPTRMRVRWLRVLLAALAIVFVLVGVSSSGANDVIYAVMEGATKLIHGVLPYGHLPGDVVHGDTYPLLSYVLYAPLVWAAPVSSTWDSVDFGLAAAGAAALAAAWALFRATAGRRAARGARRPPELEEAGLRAAFAWLAFPPLLITVSTGTTDVALAAMLAMAVLLWRRPAISSGLLTAAGWFKLAPFALLPVALAPLRGKRLAAAVAAVALVSAPLICLLIVLDGLHGVGAMIHALSFQASRGSPQSAWAALGIEGLQPLGQASVLGLLAAGVFSFRRDPTLAENGIPVAALSAAILLGTQLAVGHWASRTSLGSCRSSPSPCSPTGLRRSPPGARSHRARWRPG